MISVSVLGQAAAGARASSRAPGTAFVCVNRQEIGVPEPARNDVLVKVSSNTGPGHLPDMPRLKPAETQARTGDAHGGRRQVPKLRVPRR